MTDTAGSKHFALIGAGGFIAPRHMKAIKDTGNQLVVAVDKHDSVGIMDSYFPDASFFVEFERFDRHVEKLKRLGEDKRVQYVSICSPNYLHDAHIRFALRVGADAICEKPLVLNPWNIDALKAIEEETGHRIWTILQLRLHPAILALKQQVDAAPDRTNFDIELVYITSRGRWYHTSWKGDAAKSGGIATNIGIHFFDMLTWIFGPVRRNEVFTSLPDKASGFLELPRANVRWYLSIDANDLPAAAVAAGKRTFRALTMNDAPIEFSDGFTELHTAVYREILKGNGHTIETARPAVQLAHDIRHATPTGAQDASFSFRR